MARLEIYLPRDRISRLQLMPLDSAMQLRCNLRQSISDLVMALGDEANAKDISSTPITGDCCPLALGHIAYSKVVEVKERTLGSSLHRRMIDTSSAFHS